MFAIENGLTWADWCYTSQNKLALRHLDATDAKKAFIELKIGGVGDAASLVIPPLGKASYPLDSAEIDNAIKHLFEKRLPGLKTASFSNPDAFASCCDKLKKATTLAAKQGYLTAAFNILFENWILNCKNIEKNLDKNFYFLVIEHPNAINPFDFPLYPLGKCGTNSYQWKVHHKMTSVFVFQNNLTYKDNFKSLVGRIQHFRTGSSERQLPNPVSLSDDSASENTLLPTSPSGSNTYLYIGAGVAMALVAIGVVAAFVFSGSSPQPRDEEKGTTVVQSGKLLKDLQEKLPWS